MPVTETEAIQGILNVVEGQLASCEETLSQSLILMSQMINDSSEGLKIACLEFIKEHQQK